MVRDVHGHPFPFNSLKELHYWLERALRYGKTFHGSCSRKLYIESISELNYYQIGKIYRNQNIIAATDDIAKEGKIYEYGSNLHLHIFS